jgi:hypothetical protein
MQDPSTGIGERDGRGGPGPAEAPRSGGIFLPPHEPQGWTGDWYRCPVDGCPYRERTAYDGILGQEYCPDHGAVLEPVPPSP